MKMAYETYGKEALAPRVRQKPEMPNRTPALLDDQVLLKTLEHQTVCYHSLAVNEVGRDVHFADDGPLCLAAARFVDSISPSRMGKKFK